MRTDKWFEGKGAYMNVHPEQLLFYAITDRRFAGPQTLYEQVKLALMGGVTMLQLREKHLSHEELKKEALLIKELCRTYQVPLIINDNVELAKEIDADGVHVGAKDLNPARAREILGPDKIIGASARTLEQALTAQQQGADYLGTGAMFPTSSKADAKEVSHETAKKICAAVKIPVVAIGGITKENLAQLAGLGFCGAAMISAVFAQQDIFKGTQELKELTQQVFSS